MDLKTHIENVGTPGGDQVHDFGCNSTVDAADISKRCVRCKNKKLPEEFSKGQKRCKMCDKYFRDKAKEDNKRKMNAYWRKHAKDTHRRCNHCGKRKLVSKFSKRQKKCKACDKYYRELSKEQKKEYNKRWRAENVDAIAQYQVGYRKENKKVLREKANARDRERTKNDLQFKIRRNLRSRMYAAIKGGRKSAFTMELIGCSWDELKQHLEKQFTPLMNWKNHGTYWHIDHIIPCASFDLTLPENQRKCFHYTNLQPLEGKENQRKSDKL